MTTESVVVTATPAGVVDPAVHLPHRTLVSRR
jgi:hypothetical protein